MMVGIHELVLGLVHGRLAVVGGCPASVVPIGMSKLPLGISGRLFPASIV